MLLTEFDPSVHAVIDPSMTMEPVADFPETVVSVFSHTLFNSLAASLGGKIIAQTNDVDGVWPVYEVIYDGMRYGFCKARLGAPACVGFFEEVIGLGARRIILVGNCGVLNRSISDCGIIIPTAAIRDEGTSYHYAPAADIIAVNKKYRDVFRDLLNRISCPYTEGITWTTDAFFRETREKAERRKKAGAICVEMECAAMQALCDFRGVEFFQFLYAGDNLDQAQWDPRSLSGLSKVDEKERIVLLAFAFACEIEKRK